MALLAAGMEAPSRSSQGRGYWRNVAAALRRDPAAMIALALIVIIVLAAIFAPLISPADPYQGSMARRLRPVGDPHFLLGSDELGRDMLTRLIYGGRLSLFVGITPVLLAFIIGGSLGMLVGYVGGILNTLVMRTMDIFFAFPSVLLAVALSGAMGPGVSNSILSLTIVFIPPITRVAESITTEIRNRDFIEAARLSGAGIVPILHTHVFRNVVGPIFVYATSLISVSMVLASGLSFLGLGVRPPEAEWGFMLNTLRAAIYVNPLVAALPGIMIFVTSISFNLLSDGLRSAMDVKSS